MNKPRIGFESVSYSRLCQYGEMVVSLYENLCKYFVMYGKPYIYDEDASKDNSKDLVSLLERKRYIISFEADMDRIALKPLGHRYDEEKNFHYFHPNKEHYE